MQQRLVMTWLPPSVFRQKSGKGRTAAISHRLACSPAWLTYHLPRPCATFRFGRGTKIVSSVYGDLRSERNGTGANALRVSIFFVATTWIQRKQQFIYIRAVARCRSATQQCSTRTPRSTCKRVYLEVRPDSKALRTCRRDSCNALNRRLLNSS